MILPLGRGSEVEDWAAIRQRMLRETEAFLEEGLRHPDRYRRIPAIPVGSGEFPRGFGDVFWSQMLATS
ncbi:MAG TPA: hypothetical protein PKG54_05770 [Phycisphaerae bacterium]|nr:hypothetical protein [Phycisphaerae bacterium]HOB74017.1 hypothetical protein [Phycisphaerae bacterium]HOJ53852.1 hypothetical protein [Phycisphaerae bacterium]HOL26183.1 hypothetical protein [Phycisphaerae bacterium]HPP20170.1 hypothetical protein [Phycisphaerae bacterium]